MPPRPPASPEPSTPWTVVAHSKTRTSRNRNRRPDPVQPEAPRPSPPLRSPSAIAAEYRRIRSAWDAPSSPCCAALRALAARSAAAVSPRRAVCLGIGSFDPPDGGWEAKRRTYLQLIAFLVVVDELEKHAGESIPCIFQEPVFTSADRNFIASIGHCVVDSPEACDRITPDTFLFGIHLYRPVYALALQNHFPALFVGTGWDVWDQVSLSESHDLLRLGEMDRTYGKAAFPQDSSSNAFSSTSFYWRTAAPTRHQAAVGQADEESRDGQHENLPAGDTAESAT